MCVCGRWVACVCVGGGLSPSHDLSHATVCVQRRSDMRARITTSSVH